MGLKLKRGDEFVCLSKVRQREKQARADKLVDLRVVRVCRLARRGKHNEAIASLKRMAALQR